MTSTPVKDVGMAMNSGASTTVKKVTGSDALSFQKLLNSQTEKNNGGTVSPKKDMEKAETTKPVDKVAAEADKTEVTGKDSRDSQVEKPKEPLGEQETVLEDDEIAEAMEVLGSAALEMMQQIADAFGITVEEVQELMARMNLEQIDVMNPQKLGELLLAAAGAEDSLSLLTNEELYATFQNLMKEQGVLLQESAATLEMDEAQLVELTEEPEALPIEVTVEKSLEQNLPDEVVENSMPKDATAKNVTEAEAATDSVGNGSTDYDALTQKSVGEQSGNDKHSGQETGENQNQNGNLVLQTMKTDVTNASLQQLTEITSAWDVDTQDILKQILDYMRIQVKPDMSNLEMQLHPESLGTLHVQVVSKQGAVTANFITENEAVKAALESQMVQLKESFAEQGVKVEAIEVTVQTHEFERNLDQGRGGQQQEPEKKSRTRRINLNNLSAMDSMDYMEEEEKLAADIMTANGNTVDYTA